VAHVEIWLSAPAKDQRQHAYALLRQAAAEVLTVEPHELDVGREPGGRPFVAPRARRSDPDPRIPDVGVSVSHTRGLTAVAVCTGGEVGVDVEKVRDLPAVELARRWLNEDEASWISSHDDSSRARAFLWIWTHKEALGKVRGTGLARGGRLQQVPLPAPGRELPASALREIAPGADLTCAAPLAPPGYVLCVAGGGGTAGASVHVRWVHG
jgi:4'-phosphopantetheinyl transferase